MLHDKWTPRLPKYMRKPRRKIQIKNQTAVILVDQNAIDRIIEEVIDYGVHRSASKRNAEVS